MKSILRLVGFPAIFVFLAWIATIGAPELFSTYAWPMAGVGFFLACIGDAIEFGIEYGRKNPY